jgi:hypothetical protein
VLDSKSNGFFDVSYEFNFCEPIQKTCNGKSVFAAEFLDVYQAPTDTCEILGSASSQKF